VEMCKWGWFEVRPSSALRSRSGYAQEPRLSVMNVAAVRAAVGRPERVKSSNESWREAVDAHLQATDEAKRVIGSFCIELPGHRPEDVVTQLSKLRDLTNSGMLLREVSSALFWGMSKVLDQRQGLVAAVLGTDECPFPESPIQLQVQLPPDEMAGVLFIENLMSFDKTTRSNAHAYRSLVLVYASGFKASAKRLRTPDGVSLFYSRRGSQARETTIVFEDWLFGAGVDMPVSFWGDLDWSGMRILRTLRDTFGDVRAWEPGYAPMLTHLKGGHGHLPETADKRGQLPLSSTGCAYADTQLLPLLATHGFVDQELFNL
jgi:hypothetical protein